MIVPLQLKEGLTGAVVAFYPNDLPNVWLVYAVRVFERDDRLVFDSKMIFACLLELCAAWTRRHCGGPLCCVLGAAFLCDDDKEGSACAKDASQLFENSDH